MHENQFEYCGYRFIPYRSLSSKEKDFHYFMRNVASDMEMGIMNYDRPEAKHPYKHSEIYSLSKEKDCDLFLCLENGKLYIPCENELMRWEGVKDRIDPSFSKRSNIGYEIIESKMYASTEIVIGCNPAQSEPFVCWFCSNGDNYYWGHYGSSFESVMFKFKERCRWEEKYRSPKPVKGEQNHER